MFTSASLEAGVTLITSIIITAALSQSHTPGCQVEIWSLLALTVAALAMEKWCPQRLRLHSLIIQQRQVPSMGLALGTLITPWVSAALSAKYSRQGTQGPLYYSISCLRDSLMSSACILATLLLAAIVAPAPVDRTARRITRSSEKKKKNTETISVYRQQTVLYTSAVASILALAVFFFGGVTLPQIFFSIFTGSAYWLCINQLPKTFTLGEGIVIVQGFGLLAKIIILEYDFTGTKMQLSWCAFFTASMLFAAVALALLFATLLRLRSRSINSHSYTVYSLILGVTTVFIALYAYQPLVQDLLINFIFRGDPQRIQVITGWAVLLAFTLPSMLLLSRSGRIPNIILRKGYHILAVALFLPALFTQPQLLGIALACAFAVLVVVEVLRTGNIPGASARIHSFMGSFVDERDSGALYVTHFTLLLGMALPVWLSNALFDTSNENINNKLSSFSIWPAALVGILATGLGDAAASIVGSQFGRMPIAPKSKKTVEGTLAMAGVVMMAWTGLVYWQYISEMQCIWGVGNDSSANRNIIGLKYADKMAARQLSRLNLEPDVASRLAAHNFFTVKDLYSRTLLDLVEVLDLPYETVQSLLQHVAQTVVPHPVTALDLLRKSSESPLYLQTLLPPLDAALLGGLPAGSICELVGPAGLGKTQFCLGMCIVGCLDRLADEGRVLFIDTERKFSGERLAQIARERFPENFSIPNSIGTMLDRVLVKSPESSSKLLELLEGLESSIIDHGIKLIIIDSIASLARADFGAKDVMERQKLLGQQASRLKYLAESFRIPVLVTNQVTTAIGNAGGTSSGNNTTILTAALGPMWAHAVNTRLVMAAQQDPTTGRQLRVVTIAKSPAAPNISLAFRVTAKGVEWEEGVTPPPPQPGSVLDMVIANYQAYESEGGAAFAR